MTDVKKVLLLWFINFFDKKSPGSGVTTLANKYAFNNDSKQNEWLAEELHKPIIRKFWKRIVYSAFIYWYF